MEAKRTRWPARGSRAWLPAAVGVYVLGMAVILAFAYRNLVTIPFSWVDVVGVVIWALIPWWITAGVAARMGWGPREIVSKLRGQIGK